MELCQNLKIGKRTKIQIFFRKSNNQIFGLHGMLLRRHMQKFRNLAQLEIPKNRGELRTTCEASDEDYPYYDKNLGSKSQI